MYINNNDIKGLKHWWTRLVSCTSECFYVLEFNDGSEDIWEIESYFNEGLDYDNYRLVISIYCDLIKCYYK